MGVENTSVWATCFSILSIIHGNTMTKPSQEFLLRGYAIATITAHAPGLTCGQVLASRLLQVLQNSENWMFILRVSTSIGREITADEIQEEEDEIIERAAI